MNGTAPPLELWSRLYQAAIRVKELAPWEWMQETDVFAVQRPGTDELGFVSVMGLLGEHYAVAVYRGTEGLYGFWRLQQGDPTIAPEELFNVPQLQASFEDRNELSQKDRDVIKQLGLKFRGRQAWPLFRSYRPGYVPWYLEAEEAEFLACALEQVLDVAPRFREHPQMLTPGDDATYLARVPRETGAGLTWEDQPVTIPPDQPVSIPLAMDMEALQWLKQAPRSQARLEVDFFWLPAHIGEKGERPYYGYMLMMVDAASGMLLGNELLRPEPTLEAMYGLIPAVVVQQLARLGLVPREVSVRSGLMFDLLQLLTDDLGFTVSEVESLPALDPAREFLMQQFV